MAVLKVEASGLTPCEFGKSGELRIGELAVVIGNPLGLDLYGTMTTGIISGLNRTITIGENKMTLIQTQASINKGNSGGPLINAYGQIIGITSAKVNSAYGEGLGFAIPIDEALPIVDDLMEHGYVTGRPMIGISGEDITYIMSLYYRLPQGVCVRFITPESGAEAAGIKAGDINQLLRKHQAASDSLSTPIKVYTIVRAVMKMAYKDELIEHNPMDRVDRPSKRKDLSKAQSSMSCTVDEIQKLCEALKTEPILWQALVQLLIDSGMRIGECVGLLWSNVDFDKARITVDGTLVYSPDKGVFRDRTKNGKSREFGIDPDIIRLLKVLKEKQKLTEESEYVFTNEQTGKPLHPDSPRRYLKKLGEKCGIKGIHPHMLRHSFASIAITSGADIASVSEKLGHSDKAVTLRMYTHADAVSIDKASETYRDAIKLKKNDANNKEERTKK